MPIPYPTAARHSFWAKAAGAVLLVVAADALFYGNEPGWTLGLFALGWSAVLLIAVPAIRRRSRVPLAMAALFGLVMIEAPTPLACLLFLTAIGSAALMPRARFDDALSWAARLAAFGVLATAAIIRDLVRLGRRPAHGGGAMAAIRLVALPLAGAALFLLLFAAANPLIGHALGTVAPPDLDTVVLHLLFWSVTLALVWPSLRPRHGGVATLLPRPSGVLALPVATLALSLATFNLIFAIENGLDIAFLWSGAPLPAGVTLADYAHRGAYTLIVTALLAGAFVLVLLDPASPAGRNRPVRWLVMLWLAQNVVLVASSILRLADYIAAFSLTRLRIEALAWMALVAVGLVLVGWRLVAGRSARWLINANALAAGLMLAAFSVIDSGAIIADWNVRHARSSDDLDLCYLESLGSSALPAMIDLEHRAGGPVLRDVAATMRENTLHGLVHEQSDWHSWTWRGARQLAAARAAIKPRLHHARHCDGTRAGYDDID